MYVAYIVVLIVDITLVCVALWCYFGRQRANVEGAMGVSRRRLWVISTKKAPRQTNTNFLPVTLSMSRGNHTTLTVKPVYIVKGKGFPYSLPSVGPGADHRQSARRWLTIIYPPGGRLPLLSARLAVTFPAAENHRPLAVPSYTAWWLSQYLSFMCCVMHWVRYKRGKVFQKFSLK